MALLSEREFTGIPLAGNKLKGLCWIGCQQKHQLNGSSRRRRFVGYSTKRKLMIVDYQMVVRPPFPYHPNKTGQMVGLV